MVTMRLVLKCQHYVVSPSLDHYKLYTSLVWIGESFHSSGKKTNIISVHKKMIKSLSTSPEIDFKYEK